jgi:hypothetical protein
MILDENFAVYESVLYYDTNSCSTTWILVTI